VKEKTQENITVIVSNNEYKLKLSYVFSGQTKVQQWSRRTFWCTGTGR